MRERLSGALNDLEAAARPGDPDAVDFHEFRVDRIRAEAQAARTAAEPAPASFDGGVQRRPRPTPSFMQESANALFARALVQSKTERAAREADPGQTIVVNSI